MRSHFRFSVLAVAAATLVILGIVSSSTRLEEKAYASIPASQLKISQFRENGPGGTGSSVQSQDEFIEIYNNTDFVYTVGTTNPTFGVAPGTKGIGVFASAGNGVTDNVVTLVCTIPDGTIIPARGYVLCVNVNGYSLDTLGSTNSTTGGGTNPGPLAIAGGGLTSRGNFPIVNGSPGLPGAFTSVDIPNDAGLVLINVGTNTVTALAGDFGAVSVPSADTIIFDRVGFAPYGAGAPLQACQLTNPIPCGPAGSSRPSLADNYCEGGAAGCLRPVGDASTTFHGALVFYGDSGQYALLRRQSTLLVAGTVPRDTDNNVDDFLMVAPKPGINIALAITAFPPGASGLVSVLGAAGPHNNVAPVDLGDPGPIVSRLFDIGRTKNQLPNAERRYVIDNSGTTVNAGNMATTVQGNDPMGSFILRYGFRNASTTAAITRLRFRIDQLAVPCGPSATLVGSGEARNLAQTAPNCQGAEFATAVLKMLNMPTELVARETTDPLSPATDTVRGNVIEDTLRDRSGIGGAETAPNGGGINNSFVRTGSTQGSLVGEFATTVPVSGSPVVAGNYFYIAFRMGVVKGGSFRFIFQPEGSSGVIPAPAPAVTPVP